MKYLLSLLLTLTTLISYAQPSNDECEGAIPLNIVNYDASTYPVNLSFSTLSTFNEDPVMLESLLDIINITYTGRDVWYTFNSGNNSRLFTYHNVYETCGSILPHVPLVDGVTTVNTGFKLKRNTEYIIGVREMLIASNGNEINLPGGPINLIFNNPLENNSLENAIEIVIPSAGNTLVIDSTQLFPEGDCFYKYTPATNLAIETNFRVYNSNQLLNYSSTIIQLIAGVEYTFKGRADEINTIEHIPTPSNNNSCSNSLLATVSTTGDLYYSSRLSHNAFLYDDSGSGPMQGLGVPTSYYHFVAPITGSVQTTIDEEFIKIFDDCTGTNLRSKQGQYFSNLIPGNTYYLAVSSNENTTLSITAAPSVYSNDECDSPISLPLDGSLTEVTFSNLVDGIATASPVPYSDNNKTDRWYLVNSSSDYVEICNSGHEYQLYTNPMDCSTAEKFGSLQNSSSCKTLDAPPGSSFLIRVFGDYSSDTETIGVTIPGSESPAINDGCAGAIPITLGTIQLGQMLNATPSSDGICSENENIRDLWYSYTTSESQKIYTNTSSTVQLYTGMCGNLQLVDCNTSNSHITLTENTQYLIRVIANQEGNTEFRFAYSSYQTFDCTTATELASQQGSFTPIFNIYRASEQVASCETEEDRLGAEWFTFTATNDRQVLRITTTADATYSLYTGGCTAPVEQHCWEQSESLVSLIPGTTYHLKIESALMPTYRRPEFEYEFYDSLPNEDECGGAVNLNFTESYTNINLFPSPVSSSDSPTRCSQLKDWWVTFVAPASGSVTFYSDRSRTIEIFASCLSSENKYCSRNFNHVIQNLTPGQQYFASISSEDGSLELKYKSLPAPQLNNSCENATVVTAGDCSTMTTGNSYGNPDGVWYEFTMPASGHVEIEGTFHETYVGDCGTLKRLNEETIILTEGSTVYIKFHHERFIEFCVNTLDPVPHPNQTCNEAVDLGEISLVNCTNEEIAITTATRTGDITTNNYDLSLWYKLTTNSEKIGISLNSFTSTNLTSSSIKAYTDCTETSNGRNIKQNGDELILEDLTIGQFIYIKIDTRIDRSGNCNEILEDCGAFTGCDEDDYNEVQECREQQIAESGISIDLCIRGLLPPAANDLCSNAIAIPLSDENCDQSTSGNSNTAYDTKYNCQAGSRELFYSFTSIEQKNISINITDSNIPMNISIFEGFCTGPEIACSVDESIIIAQSNVNYIIAVSPLIGTQNSTFAICIKELIVEGNDENVGIGIADPVQSLQIEGGIAIGRTDIALPGTIRYTGSDFEGYTSGGWKTLSASATSSANENSTVLGDDLGNHLANRDINAGNNRLTNLAAPISSTDAINKSYADNQFITLENQINTILQNSNNGSSNNNSAINGEADNLGNHTATQNLVMSSNRISNLATPLANNDAATKSYVDNVAQVLSEQINNNTNASTGINGIPNNNGGGNTNNPFGTNSGDHLGNHTATQQLEMSGNQIRELPTPINPDHAANKGYVDENIEDIQNQINEIGSTNVPSSGIENIYIKKKDGDITLELETADTDFSLPISELNNGWTFEDVGQGPVVFTEDINVSISTELELYNALTRIRGADDVVDITMDGPNLLFDLHDINDGQNVPHFLLGNSFTSSGAASFDFDINNESIGIGKVGPVSSIHIDKNSVTDYIRIDKNGTTSTVIDRDGKIGIGISDPQRELDVDGQVQITTNSNASIFQLNLVENNGSYARLNMTNTSGKDITLAADPDVITANSKLNIYIEDAGDIMTYTGAKRVGINNGNPQSDLHIEHANGAANGGLRLQNTADANDDYWNFYVSSSNDELRLYANSTKVGDFDFVSGVYSSVSDERMKSSIQPLHFEWSKFMLLNAANYSFLHDTNKRKYLGLLAQEVQEIYPELVRYDEDEDTYRLDYSGTGVIAIKAVQELKKENEELKERVKNLETKLEEFIRLLK